MNDPFKDPVELRHYLVIMSASKESASTVQRALRNLQEKVDNRAAPLWIDSRGVGVFVASDFPACDIYACMFDAAAKTDFEDAKDALIVELGKDWHAKKDGKPANWLTTHLEAPMPSQRVAKPRR